MVEVGVDGGGDEGEDIDGSLAAGFDDGQHGFHEAAAGFALSAERQFPPDHGVPQGAAGWHGPRRRQAMRWAS